MSLSLSKNTDPVHKSLRCNPSAHTWGPCLFRAQLKKARSLSSATEPFEMVSSHWCTVSLKQSLNSENTRPLHYRPSCAFLESRRKSH